MARKRTRTRTLKRKSKTRRKKARRPKRTRAKVSRRRKRKVKRRKSKRRGKRKPFGGYGIDFTNRHETMEELFGKKPITPSKMTKTLWNFIKKHRLGSS